jgi:hypothetical protein
MQLSADNDSLYAAAVLRCILDCVTQSPFFHSHCISIRNTLSFAWHEVTVNERDVGASNYFFFAPRGIK